MIFWVREIAGWVLMALGLAAFWEVVDLGRKWEDGSYVTIPMIALTVIGVFLFRGGIHLLKVAVAADVPRGPGTDVSRRAHRLAPAAGGADAGTSRLAVVTASPSVCKVRPQSDHHEDDASPIGKSVDDPDDDGGEKRAVSSEGRLVPGLASGQGAEDYRDRAENEAGDRDEADETEAVGPQRRAVARHIGRSRELQVVAGAPPGRPARAARCCKRRSGRRHGGSRCCRRGSA